VASRIKSGICDGNDGISPVTAMTAFCKILTQFGDGFVAAYDGMP
jgi:hypothetical protein